MANDYVSQVTLPNNTTYDFQASYLNKVTRSQVVTGSGTAGSYTNSTYYPAKWTFNTGNTATDGDIITIKIPVAGHDYGVFMSIDNGSHYYPVVLNGTERITTHFPVNTYITVIFEPTGSAASMFALAGQTSSTRITVTGGVWRVLNYRDTNSNDIGYYHRRIYPNLKAGGAIHPYSIIMQLPNGRWSSITTTAPNNPVSGTISPKETGKAASTSGYMLGHVLAMYARATYADGNDIGTYNIWSAYSGLIDARYSFNLANSSGNGFTRYTPVYIVGTITDGLFYLDTTKWWTQTLPTSDDGKVYIYIGDAYDWYRLTFTEEKPIYWYKDGTIRLYSGASEYALSAPLSGISGADDLKAIEAISGTTGLLKKTAANTWTLDTNNYVTSSGVTKVSTSAGLTGGDITTTGTVKANLTSETKLTNAAADGTETSGRVYPVRLDKNGKLAVNVPWTNVNGSYLPLAGGIMTGNIRRYYSAASTEPMITALSNNQDIYLWQVGHSTAAATNLTNNGYKLLYKGINASTNNYLQLIATKGDGTETLAFQVDEIGNLTIGSTSTASATRTLYGTFDFKSANGFTYSGMATGSDNAARPVWFSYNGVVGRPVYDNDFKYNPSTNTLTIGTGTLTATNYSGNAATAGTADAASRINANNTITNKSGLQYACGQITLGTADGNAASGSNDSYKLWSYPVNGTAVNGTSSANIQNLRLYWNNDGKYFRDIFISPNNSKIYHRAVANGTAGDWLAILDSGNYTDYTVKKDGTGATGTWSIAITGKAGGVDWANTGHPSTFPPSSHTHSYITLYEARASTTTLNKSANYVAAGAMFHLVASSSTSATDNGKTPTDANVLQMNWDNNGGYDAQIAVSTYANRMYFRDQPHSKKAWQEVAHAPVSSSNLGSATQPVYMTSDGVLTVCTDYASASVNYATSAGSATSATTAAKLSNTSAIGGTDRPVYFTNGGIPAQTTYRMAGTNAAATTGLTYSNNLDTGIWYIKGITAADNPVTPGSTTDGAMYANKYDNNWIHEIYGDYRTGQIAVRGKNNGTWQAWRKILDSSNYTDYTVTKTGTGASGTWGISITGSAGSVAWANTGHPSTFPPTIGTTATTAMAGNTNVNNVSQTISSTTDANYRVLLSGTSDDTTRNEGTRKDADFYYNPSTNLLHVDNLDLKAGFKIRHTTIPVHTWTNAEQWWKIAQFTGYFNIDIYITGTWSSCRPTVAVINVLNMQGTVKITQKSGYISDVIGTVIKLGKVETNKWDVLIYTEGYTSGSMGQQEYWFYGYGAIDTYQPTTADTTTYSASSTLALKDISGVTVSTDNSTSGDANGQIKLAGKNISVTGLGSLAYKSSLTYSDVGALASTTKYAASSSAGGSATTVATTEDKANELIITGISSSATTTLKYNTYLTTKAGQVTIAKGTAIDNTAFNNRLILYANQSNEHASKGFTAANSSWGIGFQRKWNNATEGGVYAGIYAFGVASWRAGLVFRVKNGTAAANAHDTNALILHDDGSATFANTVNATKFQATHTAGGQQEFRVTYGSTIDMSFMVGTANENHGIYDSKKSEWVLVAGASNTWSLNGNADTATTATNLSAAPTITSGGTATVTLSANTAYTLTVGGKSVIFKTPADANTNTATAADNILDGSNSGTQITYAPYTAQQSKLSFDTSTTAPTRTDRLNLNGFLYATKYNVAGNVTLQYNSTDSSLEFVFA